MGRLVTDEAREAAGLVHRLVAAGKAPRGSLRMFGEWFGRPGDNVHECVGVDVEGDSLVLRFDQEETLRVWAPRGVAVAPTRRLEVASAARVRWEWFPYGGERTADHLRVREHPPSPGHPAVELG